MMRILLIVLVVLIAIASVGGVVYTQTLKHRGADEPIACTADAKLCADGSYVGRTGPDCSFAACPMPEDDEANNLPDDLRAHIQSKADLIRLDAPEPLEIIESPMTLTGAARGQWYFEATFPIILVDWDGRIIAEGYAEAEEDWMTEEFVPFTATLEFEKPAYGARGTIILEKSNASGLPEHADALEVPVLFEEDLTVQ